MAWIRFLVRRLAIMLLTLVLITTVLFSIMMLVPPEVRAEMYASKGRGRTPLIFTVRQYKLDDPYLVQYGRWTLGLLRGDWGYSPSLQQDVLPALLRRTGVTAELTLYSLLLFIPLGLASGVMAGWKRGRPWDRGFRLVAFIATSIPPFVLGLMLLSIFYVGLHWFPVGRISIPKEMIVDSSAFRTFTGLITIDGLLNGRLDVSLDALRHLVLPVLTLSLAHWAVLGRLTRAAVIDELGQEYMTAAVGRGMSLRRAVWKHALRNALLPGLSSIAVSAATLVTGVFVVEVIFVLPGVSEIIVRSSGADIPAAMGFAVYAVLLVLPLMLILDVLQAAVDPRVREGGL
jgi:ABC-type dipeptide/oligopeptide/nickel transport system permease component